MKNIFSDGWELRCEAQFQSHNQDKIKAYLCSPLRADSADAIRHNMQKAKAYMLYALEFTGVFAYAPHAYLPIYLHDDNPVHRKLALQFGSYMLAFSNMLYVCGDRITDGMRSEIAYAARLGKPIYVFNKNIYAAVQDVVVSENGDPNTVRLLLGYSPLGSNCPVTEFIRTQLCVAETAKEWRYGVSV